MVQQGAVIAGVDEAGRGPIAGPVVAAAVILDPGDPIAGLADSKRLTAARRAALAGEIRSRALAWSIGLCDVDEIDRLNILWATMEAMRRAVAGLATAPDGIVVDGDRCPEVGCRAVAVVGGDATVPAISAASIVAKVHRDLLMVAFDGDHPGYGFAGHKGYPTAAHIEALQRLGPCAIHRRSFGPVRAAAGCG